MGGLEIVGVSLYVPAMSRASLVLLAGLIGLGPAAAFAETPKSIGTFGSWQAFAAGGAKPTSCYVSSQPTKSEPKAAKRGDVYLLVSFRKGANGQPNVANEVSVIAGYTYKEASDVELSVSGSKYMLFTQADGAWARDSQTDEQIVGAFRRAQAATVKGTSSRGTATTDTFSLKGFDQAIAAATKACGVKAGG
jgi:invasion protein IalB